MAGAGYELRRLPKAPSGPPRERLRGGKVYIGCGDDVKPGYVGCDIRKTPAVAIQCRAWELSRHACELDEVFSRHMLEHLTIREAELALRDWRDALRDGGRVEVIVPNMAFHIEQWGRAEWTDAALAEARSDASWARAGFWGWQRECDPMRGDYNSTYWDVHKSGYDERLLAYCLTAAGFKDVRTFIEEQCHLRAEAHK